MPQSVDYGLRRDERGWLGNLPARVSVPPMPLQESVQLARALAEKHARRLTEVEDWRPLLEFTQGNPLTITVLVRQALRDGVRTREEVEALVRRLRDGEAVFKDEAVEGRSRSLAASLNYGFENAFNDAERKQLALLHLFQGFLFVNAFGAMGNPEMEWHVPQIRGITREQAIALLDRAAEVGLLTAHGGGYYSIHPALPWFFKKLFDECYPVSETRATHAFVRSIAGLADYYVYLYNEGRSEVIVELAAEEANLLHARDLARRNSWFKQVISTMQGLRVLYRERGRRAEWARLVEEIVPDFVDGTNEGPLPGLEEQWSLVTEFRVRILRDAGRLVGAERLQRASVQWDRQRADPALALRAEELDIAQRNMIRMLAASLHDLGQIQRAIGRQECAASYEESYEISLRIKDSAAAAIAAFNLGSAYLSLPALRNLDEAGGWCQRSMELGSEGDRLSCAQCLGQLGDIAKERFLDAAVAGKADLELLGYANAAVSLYLDALNLLPEDSVNDLAVAHNRLGSIYDGTGDLDQALAHYRKSIGYMEKSGNIYGAAHNRYEVAAALARRGRFADAKEYAVAARRGYEAYGEGARKDALITLELIASIEHSLKAEGAGA